MNVRMSVLKINNPFNRRLFILLVLLGTVGILALIPFELAMIDQTEPSSEAGELEPRVIVGVNTLSQIFILVVLVFFGERMLKRTGLGAPYLNAWIHQQEVPSFSKRWIYLAIGISFIGSLILMLLDAFIFLPNIHLANDLTSPMVWWHGLLAMFYGGITEELMVRFFGMTLIVWLLAVITRKQTGDLPKAFYMIGIVGAALLFGLGHLPATLQLLGELTPLIITRALVLNGLLGLWFGYLYYRKGLEYAIIAHMSADVFVHVIFTPLFY